MQQSIETYEQAIHYLFSRINYERLHGELYTVGDFKLDRMARLLSLLGDPHERLPRAVGSGCSRHRTSMPSRNG